MFKRIILIFIFLFSFLYSLEIHTIKKYKPQTGDIIFYYDNTCTIDNVIQSLLKMNLTHTTIVQDKEKAVSLSIAFIGQKGIIEYDDIQSDILKSAIGILILRPKFSNGYAYFRYKKCISRNIKIMLNKFKQKEYEFDWFYRNKGKNYRCSTWVKHIVSKCLPKSYFSNTKLRFPMYKAYNLQKFVIFAKNVKIQQK